MNCSGAWDSRAGGRWWVHCTAAGGKCCGWPQSPAPLCLQRPHKMSTWPVHIHCMAPSSTHPHLPDRCAYQRRTCAGTHYGTLCALTHWSLANAIPGAPWSPGSHLDLMCFAPFPECRLLQALRRHEGYETISPVCGWPCSRRGGGEPVPPRAHCLHPGCTALAPELWTIISAASLSYPSVFSSCFLTGWDPLHSYYRNVLLALFVSFCSQSVCWWLDIEKHMTNEGLCVPYYLT